MSDGGEQGRMAMNGASRARYWRQRALPALVWVVCVAALVVLARGRAQYLDGVGLAESYAASVAPVQDGKLESVAVDLFDSIEQGQPVAVMDDALMRAELTMAEAELGRLHSKIAAERRRLEADFASRQANAMDDLRRFRMDEEEARLQYLEMTTKQESDKVKLERLKIQMERYRDLVGQQIGEAELYDETRLRYEALRKELEENTGALAAAKAELDQAVARREAREGQSVEADTADLLEPIRLALDVQEARIQEIRERRAQLVLHSPIAGRVTQILHRSGETVLAGDPILVIEDETSRRVVAYVKEEAAGRVRPGDVAHVRSHGRPGVTATARVARLGAGIENLPVAAQNLPLLSERGYPVLIDSIPEDVFFPGERVTVRIGAAGTP